MFSGRFRVFLIAVTLLLLMGCESTERPDSGTWRESWQQMVALIPDREDLEVTAQEEICQQVLAEVREGTSTLLPAPSMTVDDLVNEWVSVAETAFFECPPREEELQSFDDAYAELDHIEESIETALSG